jgi:chromate reductase
MQVRRWRIPRESVLRDHDRVRVRPVRIGFSNARTSCRPNLPGEIRIAPNTVNQETSMSRYQIAVIVGSLRKESFNRKLATALSKLAHPDLAFKQLQIDDLPLYNQDDDARQADAVLRLKGEIAASQGVLFVTAEYNRSIPGVLKNAIDHASRPYGKSAWAGKPAGIIGVSVGAIGTSMAQQHLRNIAAYLDMPVLGQPEAFLQAKEGLFAPDGSIGEASREFLQGWVDKYAAWVKLHATAAK